MSGAATAYLVLATQRSGSTLLVESLRATGIAGNPQEFFEYLPSTGMPPQPREWFAGVEDESIPRLLDPLVPGTPDTAMAVEWRDHIRSAGRTPERCLGRQAHVESDGAVGAAGGGTAGPLRGQPAHGDPRCDRRASPYTCTSTGRTWYRRRYRFGAPHRPRFGRAMPTLSATCRTAYHAGAIAHIVNNLRSQENSWRAWFAEENITPIDIAHPVLWRNLTAIVATVLDALGLDPKLAPPPMLERQADDRSDEWVDRYRAEAPLLGLPT